jgi:hypothetical protein
MKTAVVFFGEIRGGSDNWKKILDLLITPNNADVFIHGYYYNENFLDKYDSETKLGMQNYYSTKGVNLTPPQSLFHLFKPISCLIECQQDYIDNSFQGIYEKVSDEFDEKKKINFVKIEYNAIRSQSYSRKAALELKNKYELMTNIKYDNVILTRLDINILSEIKFDLPLSFMKAMFWSKEAIAEQIIAGPSDMMNHICSFFENAPDLYLRYCDKIEHSFMQNEFFLYQHLLIKGAIIKHYMYPLDYTNSQNGLLRFDKDFVVETNNATTNSISRTKTTDITLAKRSWKLSF